MLLPIPLCPVFGLLKLASNLLPIGLSHLQLLDHPGPFDPGGLLLPLDLLGGLAYRLPIPDLCRLLGGLQLLFETRDLLTALTELHVEVVVLGHQKRFVRRAYRD